ncbi:MAG: multiheme c-type cytochrome [Vicinamibacteraceae bacterium]
MISTPQTALVAIAWIVALVLRGDPPGAMSNIRRAERLAPAIAGCRSCHRALVDRYATTAHFRTSAEASTETILGPSPSTMATHVPTTRFEVEERGTDIYQSAVWVEDGKQRRRTERIELVLGSGRRGQSYLYREGDQIYQLPLSYFRAIDGWANSPGYKDGEVSYGRRIPPRCLECHATRFTVVADPPEFGYAGGHELGIACGVCHGDGSHESLVNPAELPRTRQIDLCALCHSGAGRNLKRPPFTFEPGDRLDAHLGPAPLAADAVPDVHGNQVALLGASRCFLASDDLTCSTCHDVHEPQRNVRELSSRCAGCHEPSIHADRAMEPPPGLPAVGATCVDCHMPLQPSGLIRLAAGGRTLAPSYRTHRIGIYR